MRCTMKYRDKVRFSRLSYFIVLCALTFLGVLLARGSRRKLRIVEMPRVQAGSLDAQEFFAKFGDRVPVIVEGEVRHHPAFNISFNALKDLCGNSIVQTRVYDKNSLSWGGLVGTKYMHLAEFLDAHIVNKSKEADEQPRYLATGLSLPQICPKLELFTPIPKYVSLSVYPYDPEHYEETQGKRNQIQSPEIFIGRKNTKTEIHMDSQLGPFWMSMYIGSKTFRVITYWEAEEHLDLKNKKKKNGENRMVDQSRASQRWERKVRDSSTGEYVSKSMEIWTPDLEAFPELAKVTVYEGTVKAGDWIYLPSASLHGVRNDEASFGVSVNALYPAMVDNQVDICADSGFKLGCFIFSLYSDCPFEETGLDPSRITEEGLRECLHASKMLKDLKKEFDEGRARDMHLHEIAGYDDYESWCKGQCSLYKNFEVPNVPKQFANEILQTSCKQCEFIMSGA